MYNLTSRQEKRPDITFAGTFCKIESCCFVKKTKKGFVLVALRN